MRAPAGSPQGHPHPLLQCDAVRTRRAARRGTQHQRAPRQRLRGPLMLRGLVFLAVLLGLLLCTHSAFAQDTLFYKCTDAKGAVSMQNGTPCAPGMKQEIRRIGEVRTVPV